MSGQIFVFFLLQGVRLGSLHYSFRTLAKTAVTFDVQSDCLEIWHNIKVNSGTEFGMNLINIQCVRSDHSRKKKLIC